MRAFFGKLVESTLNCAHIHSAIPLPNRWGQMFTPKKRRIKNAHRTVLAPNCILQMSSQNRIDI